MDGSWESPGRDVTYIYIYMEKNIMCLYWIHNSMASMSVHIDIYWLVVSTPLKNISQIGSSSQLLGKYFKPPTRYIYIIIYNEDIKW